MINTSTNQPYLTVRDLIEMLSDPSVDKDLKVAARGTCENNYHFVGGIKKRAVTPVGASSPIMTLQLIP